MQNKVNNSSYHHYIKIENWGSKRLPIKLSLYVFLGMVFCNIALTESSLPSCKGTDSFKWTNCFGTEKKNTEYDPLYKDQYKKKKILYEGEYRSGKFHGQGTITYPDGIKYVGELKYNKPNGQGTMNFSNGTRYID